MELPRLRGRDRIELYYNTALLFILYVMQGIPIGLADVFPYIIQTRGANYKELAIFSLTSWPFSLKVLWAPIVDALYVRQLGRRKCWVVITQLMIGLTFYYLSQGLSTRLMRVNEWSTLLNTTFSFMLLMFLAATQDVAVDGWGLNLLPRSYISLASTCNTAGQTVGYLMGNLGFIILTTSSFRASYTRNNNSEEVPPYVTEDQFFYYCSLGFIVITLCVLFFKKESDSPRNSGHTAIEDIKDSYGKLVNFVRIPQIFMICIMILTAKFGFVVSDSLVTPKLIEAGLTRAEISRLAIPSLLLQIAVSLLVSHQLQSRNPVTFFLNVFPYRMLFTGVSVIFVWWAQAYVSPDRSLFFYITLIHTLCQQILSYSQFVPLMCFFSLIVDPNYGASQLTLLNTVSNLAYKWPNTLFLYLLDTFTIKSCAATPSTLNASSLRHHSKTCVPTFDGFYALAPVCMIGGFLWWYLFKAKFLRVGLSAIDLSSEHLLSSNKHL